MIISLSKTYICRYGTPALDRVHTSIFGYKYFAHCMACNFCHDWCCWEGADVDIENSVRVSAYRSELERYTGVPQKEWFDENDTTEDEEAPGGLWLRTTVKNGACVFLNRTSRGCMLHSFSLSKNLDYHDLKPMVCAIFPLTFEDGLLVHADEVEDKELVCANEGLSLYNGVRAELLYYFGKELIGELDELQRKHTELSEVRMPEKAGERI